MNITVVRKDDGCKFIPDNSIDLANKLLVDSDSQGPDKGKGEGIANVPLLSLHLDFFKAELIADEHFQQVAQRGDQLQIGCGDRLLHVLPYLVQQLLHYFRVK